MPTGDAETSRRCDSCSEPVDPGAAFCRNCGKRVAVGASPSEPDLKPKLPPPPPRPEARGKRPSRTVVFLAFLISVILGVVAGWGLFQLVSRDDLELSEVSARATEDGSADDEQGEESSDAPVADAISSGDYVRAGSFLTEDAAQSEAMRLRSRTGLDIGLAPSEIATETLPGFFILIVGPVDGGEANDAVKALKRGGVSDAFSGELSPASELTDPGSLAGAWNANLRQADPRLSETGAIRTMFSIDPSGQGGETSYPGGCRGSLELEGTEGSVATYSEALDGGSCPAPGEWLVKRTAGGIGVLRRPTGSGPVIYGEPG